MKMKFVYGTSSEVEKELQFSRQTNEEFYAQKKKQQHAKDVSKKTCFKCQQIGPVGAEKEKKQFEVAKQKSPKFEPKQIWKPNTCKFEPKPTWKPKIDLPKRNVHNDLRFY
ncbi:hypothetical protein Hanom_Chr14g01249561 [Helianthus anomalus]